MWHNVANVDKFMNLFPIFIYLLCVFAGGWLLLFLLYVYIYRVRQIYSYKMNDFLRVYLKLQMDLILLVLQWRMHGIVCLVDLERMY